MKPPEATSLDAIDWSRPWLAHWRERGEPLAAQALRGGLVNALNRAAAEPIELRAGRLQFVEHAELPAGEAYESFIARSACVPTRANLHDFFNGLAWLMHPALKRRLNELQAAQIANAPTSAPRGAVRDALTLLDENAALLQAPPVLLDALRERDWQALFITHRAAWADARIELFGHALVEKLVRPRKAITAHVWIVPRGTAAMAAWLADALTPAQLAAKPFVPLPVFGVPGWWADNESPVFYRDDKVFRPAQKQTAARGPLFRTARR
ncbi:MAG: DUF3025 domain-containing protein [Burkholderiales bacterium]